MYCSVNAFFQEKLKDLSCQPETKAYIISIYDKYKNSNFDFSKENVTLLFIEAKEKHSFASYQNIGDWIFFSNTFAPKHLNKASKEYYDNLGMISYGACYNLINRQWKLFQELSDNFITLEEQVKIKLEDIK